MPDAGSPSQPLDMKCTSIGFTGPGEGYLCIVGTDNRQFYFKLRPAATLLWASQIGEFNATIPVSEVKAI